ncbi:MAG TPA: ABC transporter permease subunit [Roseiarcus sp.]|nr:ABC transporter permease subunit [Roseiarcus sp.]
MTESARTIEEGFQPSSSAQSPSRRALRRFRRNQPAMAGLLALIAIALVCVFGPLLSPHPYDRVYRDYVKIAPSLAVHPTEAEKSRIVARAAGESEGVVEARLQPIVFPLGTDSNGRDLWARLLIGGRVSLLVGALASAVALVNGVAYGAIAGYFGGRVDLVMMRIVDVLYALPFIFFVILLIVVLGRSFLLVVAAIGAVEWLDMARIVRGRALSLKRQDYVLAAEALGVDARGVLLRHIVPNLIGPVIAYLTLVAAKVILLESFLSFLGLGVQEPMTSLGALIADGARNIEDAPGMLIFPAALLSALLLALTLIGEGLSDALGARER